MIPTWLVNLTRRVRAALPGDWSGWPEEWSFLPPLTVDADGWLQGEGVEHVPMHPSWRYTEPMRPLGVVWHYTATDAGTAGGMAGRRQQPWSEFAAAHRRSYPKRPVPQTSWHLSVETYGGIVQMAPLTVGTWHAGSPTAKRLPIGWPNRCTIGIELVGHGRAFPQSQVADAARVLRALVAAYGIERRWAGITHAEIDPGRRSDPGPVWASKHAPEVLDYACGAP